MSDNAYHITFYGVYLNHWKVTFGSFVNHHYILVENYLSDGVASTPSTQLTEVSNNVIKFIYPLQIRKKYFIEGVAQGQLTVTCNGDDGYISGYTVEICKVKADGTTETLYSTGRISVNYTLDWDATYEVGEELVLPFWIDCSEHKSLNENERLFVKLIIDTGSGYVNDTYLLHSNDANWEDFKIDIPFRW